MHFGSPKYPDFLIHQDDSRKKRYLARAKKIKNKQGELTWEKPESANYWSTRLLWARKYLNFSLKIILIIIKMWLTSYENFTSNNIILKEAKEYKVKDSKLKYKRIQIEAKYPDGKKGDIVIETPFLFSFGVNEKKISRNKQTSWL